MLLGFEHVGMAVSNMDTSIAFYCDLLGLKLLLRKTDAESGAELAFVDAGGGQLEISSPGKRLDAATDLPPGQAGVKHITFRYDAIAPVYDRLMAAGIASVSVPRPARHQEMISRTCFVRDPDGVIVELIEK